MRAARVALCAGLLVVLCAAPAQGGSASAVRKSYGSLLAGVTARRGIQHRSLVLVPLVLSAAAAKNGITVDASRLSWAPGDEKHPERSAVLTWEKGTVGLGAAPVLVPSGQVLRVGDHERLLLRPSLLKPGEAAVLRTRSVTPFLKDADATSSVPARAGLAGPEFGHTLFLLDEREAIEDLLKLEGSTLDLDPKKTKLSLARLAATVKAQVSEGAKAILPLGKAFGGSTVGHAAFMGGGIVQLVLAKSPETYASYLPRAAHGLALALAVWERMVARAAGTPKPVRWERYIQGTTRVLGFLKAASFKREKRRDERGAAGELWRVRATKATRGGRPPDVGWLVVDAEASPVWFEAWPDSAPFPPARSTPGVPGADSEDDGMQSGASTWYFAKRFYERFPWRREPLWLSTTSRPALDGPKTKR